MEMSYYMFCESGNGLGKQNRCTFKDENAYVIARW